MATPTSLKFRDVTSSKAFDHKVADTNVKEYLLFEFGENTPTDLSIIRAVASECTASMLQGEDLMKVLRVHRDALRTVALEAWDRKEFKIIRDIGVFAWTKSPNPVFI